MKKINTLINTIMGASIGVFIGNIISSIWTLNVHPETYAIQSAPWYTSSLIYGAVTIGILTICFICKEIVRRKQFEEKIN